MRISVNDAEGQLTELVRLAEAGEEVILTHYGNPVVRLTPVRRALSRDERRQILEDLSKAGAAKALAGPSAARSQDFLYNEDGLPE